jgi:hypothetical protein
MLVKAVALSLVLGGVGFVENNAQAAEIGPAVRAETGVNKFADVLSYEDGKKINTEAGTAKVIATKAYGMAQQEQVDRKFADLQIREDMKKADKDLSDKIDANAKDIATNKTNIQQNANNISDNTIAIQKEAAARKGTLQMLDSKLVWKNKSAKMLTKN